MLLVLKNLFFTGLNMRWKLNCFKGNSLEQASVLFRTLFSRLFTRARDNDVTFCRKHTQCGVTLSNLFTPINRASRNSKSLDRPSSSLCNRYRAFAKVSTLGIKEIRAVCCRQLTKPNLRLSRTLCSDRLIVQLCRPSLVFCCWRSLKGF